MQENSQSEPVRRPDKVTGPKRWLRLGIYAVLGLVMAAAIVPRTPWYKEHERAKAREVLQQWCRLDAFPEQRSAESMHMIDNLMSPSFTYAFVAAPEALAAWQAASPGFKDARAELSGQTRRFSIKPFKAQRCQVAIDQQTGLVSIEASWS